MIDMESLEKRCVAKEDGSPKSSVYLSVYRALETIPLSSLKSLYLTTDHGTALELKRLYTTKAGKTPMPFTLSGTMSGYSSCCQRSSTFGFPEGTY
jgi:hypothetical protein